jgi:hypothetical protein
MFFFATGAEVKQVRVFAPIKPFYTLSDIFSKALLALLYIRCIRAGCALGLGQTNKFLAKIKVV